MSLPTCTASDLAECHLGFKSLQNIFFYVDEETIKRYGIESEYLLPVFKLADLDRRSFYQSRSPKRYLFNCKSAESDLHGTGALKYIRGLAAQPAGRKKQGGKLTTIKAALSAQSGARWYAPKATPHDANVWVRKAFHGIYAPFLFGKEAVVDQRCNYLKPKKKVSWKELASLATSTLFALAMESAGGASMGAGALEVPTKLLRRVRVPDVRAMSAADRGELVRRAEAAWKEKPIDWEEGERPSEALQALDEFLLGRMSKSIKLQRVYDDLVLTLESRIRLAKTKADSKKATERRDVGSVVEAIAEGVEPLLDGRRFPESFILETEEIALAFPSNTQLGVSCEPFLGASTVQVCDAAGNILLRQDFPTSVAQVLLRALMCGRREFRIPLAESVAANALRGFDGWFLPIDERIRVACSSTALGTRFEDQLYGLVLQRLRLHPEVVAPEIYGRFELP
jgi:hypothetical protein